MFYSITIILAMSFLMWPAVLLINPETSKMTCIFGIFATLIGFIFAIIAMSLSSAEDFADDEDWE